MSERVEPHYLIDAEAPNTGDLAICLGSTIFGPVIELWHHSQGADDRLLTRLTPHQAGVVAQILAGYAQSHGYPSGYQQGTYGSWSAG